MEKDDCFCLGYVAKPSGMAGELVCQLSTDDPSRYKDLQMLLLELGGGLVPFFVKRIHIRGHTAVLSLEGIDSIEKAEELAGASIFLPLTQLPALDDTRFYLHEIVGFEVIDRAFGTVGKATGVLDFPAQRVLQVLHQKQEILIPLHKETVERVDREKQQLLVNVPEGLIELYLDLRRDDL